MKKTISILVAFVLVINLCSFFVVSSYAAQPDTYTLKSIIRDFDPVNSNHPERNHPDFENEEYFNTNSTGAVKSRLGSDNTPVYSDSGYSVKIITSADSFYDWYHDTDKNITIPYDMVFKKSGSMYTFDSTSTDGFFPINNKGFGNYQDNKNYHFTMELHTKFVFEYGQVFELAGDDDLWLFVNKELVGDLGGIHETQYKTVNMDNYIHSMNLKPGDVCTLDLFFAERHVTESNLKISTNIELYSAEDWEDNKRPIADAGDNIVVRTNGKTASVRLDGSGSKDPDGDRLTYTWTNEAGDVIGRDVLPTVDLPVGLNICKLTVSDGRQTDSDTVAIEVIYTGDDQNKAPKADAGDDQDKTISGTKTTITLDGSLSSDPDGDKLTYTWTNENGERIATGVKPQIELTKGTHRIKLTVSDGELSDTDTVVITISNNRAPLANAGNNQSKTITGEKVTVTLDGSKSSDPDGDRLTYRWADEDGDRIATGEKPQIELTEGTHRIKLTVSDGELSDTDTVVIRIYKAATSTPKPTSANSRPVANAGADKTVMTDEKVAEVTLDGSKSYDHDGDSLSYRWKDESGATIGRTAKPSVLLPVGENVLTLTVSDGKLSDTDKVIIKVEREEIPGGSNKKDLLDLGIALTADQTKVEEGNQIIFTIKYLNKTDVKIPDVEVDFKLGDGMEVVEAAKGKASGKTIVWDVGDLAPKEKGEIEFKVKSDTIQEAEVIKDFVASISSNEVELANTYDDRSKLDVMVYSDRYLKRHTRYILGYPDNTFKGERNITRAETAVIFARILDLKDLKAKNTNQFVDVPKGFWAEEHIYAAVQSGLFKGVDSTHFNPDVPITRAEFVTVIANYLKIQRTSEEAPFTHTFNDIQNHWAQGNIEEIARYDIVKGYADGSFRPQKQILRQEAVTMINRLLYRGPLTNVTNSFPDITSDHWAFGEVEEAVRSHEFIINDKGEEVMTEYINDPIW